MKHLALLATLSAALVCSATAQTTIGGPGAALDVADVTNWTTNNTVYDRATNNGGLAMNFENVLVNTAAPNGTTHFDVSFQTNTNFTIGHVFMYNQTFDMTTLGAEGITSIDWTVDFESSSGANDNWYPVIAVTDGGVTRYYTHDGNNNPWNGNAAKNFGSEGNLANNSFWGEMNSTGGTIGASVDGASNPNISRVKLDYDTSTGWVLGGTAITATQIQFGFMVWNASTGGTINPQVDYTVAIDAFEVTLGTASVPDPDFYIGGGTANASPDVTDVTNWTTNSDPFAQLVQVGTDDGYILDWENVTQTAVVDGVNNEFDCSAVGGPNYTSGILYMYTAESIDLSTLPNGLTRLAMSGDFNSSTLTNWIPVMAVTDGSGITTYYRSSNTGNVWGTNNPVSFFDGSTTVASDNFAGLKPADGTTTTIDNTRDLGQTPELRPEWVWDVPTQMWNLEGAPTGTATFGFIQWGASSGGSVNQPAFSTTVDAFEVYGYSNAADIGPAPPDYVGLAGALDSSDFDYRYELDSDPSVQDLDANLANDWSNNSFTDYSTIPGVMRKTGSTNLLLRSDQSSTAPGVDTIDQATLNGDVTLEVRARVGGTPLSRGYMTIVVQQPGTNDALQLEINTDSVHMNANVSNEPVTTGDNTDAFHIWRVAYNKDDNQFWVWRDGVLIYGGGLEPGNGWNPTRGNVLHGQGLWWVGDSSSGLGGTVEVDYIRAHGSAVSPLATTWTASSDGNWDTTTTNWDQGSGAVAYTDGDEVVFPDGAASGAVTLSGTIEPGAVEFSNNTLAYTLGGTGIGGASSLSVNGGGSVTLNNANTYTGITEVAAGSLTVGSGGSIGESTVLVRDTATLTVASGGGIGTTNTTEMTTRIQGGGTLVVDAGGMVGFSSVTVENGGTATANGTLGDINEFMSVTVDPGGTIGGTGTVNADLFLSGNINPGASAGTLTVGTILELGGGSSYTWEISTWGGAAGTDYDQVVADEIDVVATAGDEMTIVITPDSISGFAETAQTYVIFSAISSLLNFDAAAFTIDDSAFVTATGSAGTWAVQQNGNTIELVYTAGVADPYGAWAQTNITDINPGAPSGFDEDAEGDGLNNGLEWILGGDPLAQDAGGLVTTNGDATTGLTLDFTREEDSISAATLVVQWSHNLDGTWTDVTVGATSSSEANGVEITVNDVPDDPDEVSVNIPASNGPDGKLFARLKASQP